MQNYIKTSHSSHGRPVLAETSIISDKGKNRVYINKKLSQGLVSLCLMLSQPGVVSATLTLGSALNSGLQ